MTETEAKWRECWRVGFAPQLSDAGLAALAEALEADDRRLLQGATCTPPPMQCVADWPAEACCPVGYCGWRGDGLATVGEVEEFFGRVCREADRRLGGQSECRWLLNWIDETPRDEMRPRLLEEVRAEVARRVGK